ncbi:phosphofructokinase domain-containing protein [Pisolithus sp. B1]|nr:phosphofructokinase domain-containing protein [Pisolithus sp. B1]
MLARTLSAVPLFAVAGGEPGVNATVVPSTASGASIASPLQQVNLLPATPPQTDSWRDEMYEAISMHREVGKRKTLVIVAEGVHDSNLKPIRADCVRDVLTERLGLDSRVITPGHIQRGGRSYAFDRILAVKAILEATPDTPSYTIDVRENKITRVPPMETVEMTRAVADAIVAKDFAKAMSLRDPGFLQSLEGFMTTSLLYKEKMLSEETLGTQVAVVRVGAPAGGMNTASRAAVRYCIKQGHTLLTVHSGFKGLLDDHIHELSWLGVDGWTSRGGSELCTNRTLLNVDPGAVAARFQQHDFHALMLIGGFEAFNSLLILENGRSLYPAFLIPMVRLPAMISNNDPMSEFSLGRDTSLNALVDACDAIKQSASASRNWVFVVETLGGQCGYVATMGALATGVSLVYISEQGMDPDMLRADVKFLKIRYGLDVKDKIEGRLVIRIECASEVYTADMLTDMFREEGGGLFDSRYASLGHILQGGVPTPTDRARAARLSLRCMAFLEEHHQSVLTQPPKSRCAPLESAAVITIQRSALKWVAVTEMVKHADMKNRRGKEAWWEPVKGCVEALSGRSELV